MDGGGGIEEPFILERILSFLTTKEAAKTSLLSKPWLEAWRTRPTLEFDENLFLLFLTKRSMAYLSAQDRERALKNRIRQFSSYIETTMERYSDSKIRINTLKLRLVSGFVPKSVIQESIRIAGENNMRNLDLTLCLSDNNDLGEIVFGGKSIIDLKLRACTLKTLSVNQIRSRNIKTLNFYMVSLDELMFENIILGCPLLEFLKIGWSGGIVDGGLNEEDEEDEDTQGYGYGFQFRVEQHPNLRQIDVEFLKYQSLIVGKLPRLESLVCAMEVQDVWRGDDDWTPSGFILHSSRYQNIKALTLCAVGIGDDFFHNFASMFPNLEDLSIKFCPNLQVVELSSQSIKRIKFCNNQGLKEARLDILKIVHFEYRDGGVGEIPLLSFTPVSGCWASFLNIGWRYGVPNTWLLRLKELLSCLVQSELSLTVHIPKIPALNVEEIRDMFVYDDPVMVEELSIDFSYKEESALSILDGLFWVLRPRILCQPLAVTAASIELLNNIVVLKRNQDQIRFWQDDLKDVQIGTYSSNGFGDRFLRPKTYQFRGAGCCYINDWLGFLDVAKPIAGIRGICFKFEWIT